MATVIPKLKCETCEDCLDPVYDISCGSDCASTYVEYHRMAGAVGCTCNEMSFTACTTFESFDNCSCSDEEGTTAPGKRISGAWFGWNNASETIESIRDQLCPGQPINFKLYGSVPSLNCCTSTAGLPLLWNSTDVPPTPIERDGDDNCVGGAFFLDAGALGIEIVPTPGGTGTDCSQTGGYSTYVMEMTDSCGNLLALCEFKGIFGGPFTCGSPPGYCCLYNISESVTPCNLDGGIGNIHIDAIRTPNCSCIPTTATITINDTIYTLGADTPIDYPVDPCFCGVTQITITLDLIFPVDCTFDCTPFNSHEIIHQFFMPCT